MVAWRCAHKTKDVLLAWEGEQHVVFFNPNSGDTHLVSAFALLLTEMLAPEALSRAQIVANLTEGLETDVDLPALLDTHLPRLTTIGLLQEVPI